MKHPPPKPKCWPCLGALLLALVVLALAFGWVAKVAQKVFSGAGMEHCCSIEGVPFNYLGVFVLLCGVATVVVLAAVFRVRDWLLRRDFERKYGVKAPASAEHSPPFGGSDSGPSFHGIDYSDDD
jgi:hypothetical protein